MEGWLEEVKRRFPQCFRIILSDQKTILRAVDPTHQYLAKPCDTNELKRRLTRAFAVRGLLKNSELQAVVSRLQALPNSAPVMTGMRMSVTMMSKGCSSIRCKASDPLVTKAMSHSSRMERRLRCSPDRTIGSSSTNSMRFDMSAVSPCHGQLNEESCAFADFGFEPDLAAVLFHD